MNNQVSDTIKHDILDRMEILENEILELRAISGFLGRCSTADSVEPSELCFLLDPIVEREMSVVEEVRRLFADLARRSRTAD